MLPHNGNFRQILLRRPEIRYSVINQLFQINRIRRLPVSLQQSGTNGADQQSPYQSIVIKTHFRLGRMNIHVHISRINIKNKAHIG